MILCKTEMRCYLYIRVEGSVFPLITVIIYIIIQTGSTPLYIASQNGSTDVVDTLIRVGASVNQACMVWRLHYNNAVTVYPVYTVHDAGTDVMIECVHTVTVYMISSYLCFPAQDGRRPIDIARANCDSDTVRLLE